MNKLDVKVFHEDERGSIIDLLQDEHINAITLVTFKRDSIRGNHYHNETVQWNFVVSGKIKILAQRQEKRVEEMIMEKGDLVLTSPSERHTLIALEESELLVFTKGPRSGREYESDTFRLGRPLEVPK